MTLDNITGITKGSWTVDSLFCKSQLITCNRVNECNGVCPFEDALKHADKEQSLNEQNNEHDREWIIGCIKHDGFIKTDRFDKANQIILDALQFAEHFDLLKEHESLQVVVRCKDCMHRHEYECPMYHEEWFTIDEGDGYVDDDYNVIDKTDDDGFCQCGERGNDGKISNT